MEAEKRAYFQEVHHEPERYNHDPVKNTLNVLTKNDNMRFESLFWLSFI